MISINKIDKRLDIVEELLNNKQERKYARDKLKEVSDLERVISRVSSNRASPRDIYNIAVTLDVLGTIKNKFINYKNILSLLDLMKDTSQIKNIIFNTITDDPPIIINKGKFIKKGFCKELDKIREIADNASNWLVKYQESERKNTRITEKVG